MLNYTIKNLSKTGFFLGGSNINSFQKNMVPFLFCSRNNFYVIDVIEFLNYTKKILFLFQKLFLNHSNILMIFDSLFFKKKIEDKLSLFFSFLKKYNKNEESFYIDKGYSKGIVYTYKKQLSFINNYIYDSSFFLNFVNFYSFYVNNRNSGLNSFFNKIKDFRINFNYIKFISYSLNFSNLRKKRINNNFFFSYFLKFKKISFLINKNLNFLFKNLNYHYPFSYFKVFKISNLKDYYILTNLKRQKLIFLLKNLNLYVYNYFFKYTSKLHFLKNKLFLFFNLINFEKFLVSEISLKDKFYSSKIFIKSNFFLQNFLKKNLFKKYNFLFFIDNKIKIVKKWLFFFKKKKNLNFVKNKLNLIYSFLNILLKFKKDLYLFNRMFNSFYLKSHKEKLNTNFTSSSLSFNSYINRLNNKYLVGNLSFWYGKWLNGSLTNYYGLKKNLKKDVEDFKNLKMIPEFIMLFSLKNGEGFLNETSTLSIPLGGISDIKNNPFFFQYYVPANSLDNDFLYFYLLLIFESFLRGFLKEVNSIAN